MSGRGLFSSPRERRLWGWTAAVVVAIWSTLALARTVALALNDGGWLGAGTFVLASLLVLAAVITQGLTARPSGTELMVTLGVAAAYLLVFVRITAPTERSHLVEYGVVAIFVYEALKERAAQGRRVPAPALLAVLATSCLGAIDEGIQVFLPSRVFDPIDIAFNVVAAVMAVGASAVLAWARRRRHRAAS